MMKYIDIEFANQAVMIPLYADVPPKEDTISDLINTNDIVREQKAAKLFDGCLIPPSTIWRSISDRNKYEHACKTKPFKRVRDENKNQILYIQDDQFCILFYFIYFIQIYISTKS